MDLHPYDTIRHDTTHHNKFVKIKNQMVMIKYEDGVTTNGG
jgi:hypothetical protein